MFVHAWQTYGLAELTGTVKQEERERIWATDVTRVYFMTPQTFYNDVKTGENSAALQIVQTHDRLRNSNSLLLPAACLGCLEILVNFRLKSQRMCGLNLLGCTGSHALVPAVA